jgi:hypothetical protein
MPSPFELLVIPCHAIAVQEAQGKVAPALVVALF